jgi:tetratricopeptide (TPR) repeat protein
MGDPLMFLSSTDGGSRAGHPRHKCVHPKRQLVDKSVVNDPQPPCRPESSKPETSIYCVLLIVIATLVTFGPVVRNQFTNWDDQTTIANNARLHGPIGESLSYYWKHSASELYVPVTYTVWTVLAKVAPVPSGEIRLPNAAVFHGASVLVHALAAVMVFLILRRLVREEWAACAGALLFALHPLQAEPIAWASGMKDLLCGMLALVSIWQYVVFAQRDSSDRARWINYAWATVALGLALLAKPTAVVIPAMALVVDVLLVGRPIRVAGKSVLPWIVLLVPCVIWTKFSQPAALGVATAGWAKPLIAGDAIAFYLGKLVAPISLGIDYGRNPEFVLARGGAVAMCLAVAALAIVLWRMRSRELGAAGLLILIGIAPVLGFVPFSFQSRSTVADHYFYLSAFGAAVAAAWVIVHVPRRAGFLGCAIVLGALALRSLDQTRHWKDSRSLFERAVAVNPRSYSGYQDLAVLACNDAELKSAGAQIHADRGNAVEAAKFKEAALQEQRRAETLFAKTLELKPGFPFALHSRATFHARFGRHDKAIADLWALIAEFPNLRAVEREQLIEDYSFLGWEYLVTKRPVLAAEAFEQMLKVRPGFLPALRGREKAMALTQPPATRPVAVSD